MPKMAHHLVHILGNRLKIWWRDSDPTSHFCPEVGDFPGHETFSAKIRKVPDKQGGGGGEGFGGEKQREKQTPH